MSMEIDSFLSYLKNIKRYSALTITAYKEDLNQFREFCEKVELIRQDEEITSKMVRRFEMGLMSGGLKIGGVDGEEKLGFLGDRQDEALLLQQLIHADVMVSSFMREKGSLESLFMQITGHEEERAVLKHEMESGI